MEQHPVPQNVTGFQFKLIGDITLKQFAYLAGGVILGYLTTKFSFLPYFLLFPLAAFWVLLGFGLAFVPIEERPLDRWLTSFIKRIYSPTQYVWQKNNPPPDILVKASVEQSSVPTTQPQLQLASTPTYPPHIVPPSPLPQSEPSKPHAAETPSSFHSDMRVVATPPVRIVHPGSSPVSGSWAIGAPLVSNKTPPPSMSSQTPVTRQQLVMSQPTPAASFSQPPQPRVNMGKLESKYQATEKRLSDQIVSLQKELSQGTIAKERIVELQQVLVDLASEKERLSKELRDLKQKLENNQVVPTEKPFASSISSQPTSVKIVTPHVATHVGIPKLTSLPNIITGIVRDGKGTLLPNIIITVKDKEGVPVRALKTNKLGQFAASTPLSNGTYFVEVEDPQKTYQFKRIEVNLTSQVLSPVDISAISEKDVVREKLTQELFGGNKI